MTTQPTSVQSVDLTLIILWDAVTLSPMLASAHRLTIVTIPSYTAFETCMGSPRNTNPAYIEMSFKVECSPGSRYFPNYACELEGNCSCLPGYTGALCDVEIDDCIGVDCSGNGECIDRLNAFECICSPGYTGALCEVKIII